MEVVQAHLLAWGVLRDGAIDGPRGRAETPDLLPLLFEAHAKLSDIFQARDPFWNDYRRLVRQQAESDRWEIAASTRAGFGPLLIRRLGRKAALGRWPAAAVARRLGCPRLAAPIDLAFEDLLAALQLVDDVTDAEEDAAAGQVNAVLVAGRASAHAHGALLHACIIRGIPVVVAAARVRLRRLSRCPGGIGDFSQWALAGLDDAERSSIENIRHRAAASILARVFE